MYIIYTKHQYNIYSIIIAKAMLLATWVLLQTWEQQPPRVSAVLLGILCAALLLIQAVAWALTMTSLRLWQVKPFWFTAWALETCPRNSRCSKSSTAGLLSFKLSTSKRWEQSDAIGVYCIHVCTTLSAARMQNFLSSNAVILFRTLSHFLLSQHAWKPHFRGKKTHTAADGIRQFPTTNKHPTSSDECHFDMIFIDFPFNSKPAGSGELWKFDARVATLSSFPPTFLAFGTFIKPLAALQL